MMIFPPGVLYALLATLLWGVGDFFCALASKKIGSFKLLFWNVLAGTILMIICLYLSGSRLVIPLNVMPIVIAIGLTQIAGTVFFYKGFEAGKVSVVSPLAAVCSFWTIIISLVFLGEKMKLLQIGGAALIIIGTFLIATKLKEFLTQAKFSLSDPGVKFGLLASIFWGTTYAFLSPLTKELGWLPASLLLRLSMAAWVFVFIPLSKKEVRFSFNRLIFLLFLIIVFTDVFGYLFDGMAFEKGAASIVAPVASVFPMITILMAWIFLKEKLVLNQVFGIIGIIGGLVLLSI